jgi:hypothetical protein
LLIGQFLSPCVPSLGSLWIVTHTEDFLANADEIANAKLLPPSSGQRPQDRSSFAASSARAESFSEARQTKRSRSRKRRLPPRDRPAAPALHEPFDLDPLIEANPIRGALDAAEGARRAEVADQAELLARERPSPGAEDVLEASGGLGGQLDLDGDGRVIQEDEIGAVEALAVLGGVDALAFGLLDGCDLALGEDAVAFAFELGGDVG